MQRLALLAMLSLTLGLFAQAADTLDFPQPQFVNPIFDSFTRNYISTQAMGRGYTGIAIPGKVDNVLLNPAGYIPEKASLHLEMLVKPPVDIDFYGENDRLTSPVPFGIVAAGGKLAPNFTGALLYSLPKTVQMDDYSIEMNLGGYLLVRYPTFNLHQFTANGAWHGERLHVGINLHNQIYYLTDTPFLRTFERIITGKYVFRPQLGLLYEGDNFNAGLSVTPQQNVEWDLKYVVYDTQLPLNISVGGAYKKNNAQYTAELNYEQTSVLADEFRDRYTVRVGVEKTVRKFTYRAGYIYHPEVWHGHYRLPANTTATADTALWWDDVATGGELSKNTQHILTAGTTWHHPDVNINLGFLLEVSGNEPVAQISASMDLFFSAFRKKNFLYFD